MVDVLAADLGQIFTWDSLTKPLNIGKRINFRLNVSDNFIPAPPAAPDYFLRFHLTGFIFDHKLPSSLKVRRIKRGETEHYGLSLSPKVVSPVSSSTSALEASRVSSSELRCNSEQDDSPKTEIKKRMFCFSNPLDIPVTKTSSNSSDMFKCYPIYSYIPAYLPPTYCSSTVEFSYYVNISLVQRNPRSDFLVNNDQILWKREYPIRILPSAKSLIPIQELIYETLCHEPLQEFLLPGPPLYPPLPSTFNSASSLHWYRQFGGGLFYGSEESPLVLPLGFVRETRPEEIRKQMNQVEAGFDYLQWAISMYKNLEPDGSLISRSSVEKYKNALESQKFKDAMKSTKRPVLDPSVSSVDRTSDARGSLDMERNDSICGDLSEVDRFRKQHETQTPISRKAVLHLSPIMSSADLNPRGSYSRSQSGSRSSRTPSINHVSSLRQSVASDSTSSLDEESVKKTHNGADNQNAAAVSKSKASPKNIDPKMCSRSGSKLNCSAQLDAMLELWVFHGDWHTDLNEDSRRDTFCDVEADHSASTSGVLIRISLQDRFLCTMTLEGPVLLSGVQKSLLFPSLRERKKSQGDSNFKFLLDSQGQIRIFLDFSRAQALIIEIHTTLTAVETIYQPPLSAEEIDIWINRRAQQAKQSFAKRKFLNINDKPRVIADKPPYQRTVLTRKSCVIQKQIRHVLQQTITHIDIDPPSDLCPSFANELVSLHYTFDVDFICASQNGELLDLSQSPERPVGEPPAFLVLNGPVATKNMVTAKWCGTLLLCHGHNKDDILDLVEDEEQIVKQSSSCFSSRERKFVFDQN